eukprot:TRINITY_DN25882_c0_g1_i1.p1 TRINITY_DN25882_c0_g1~~TRINITY_DN25882_c0_g1_i1.p1  ORF type:complete len:160 (+),score=14.62 TRINITY_DN25882_c0_g1_i1:54-533(+)
MLAAVTENLPNPAWGKYVTRYFVGEDVKEEVIGTTVDSCGWGDVDISTKAVREWYESCGYTVRGGSMYGCDFVLYRGDPCHYHSEYCVWVTAHSNSFSWLELQALARLAEKVRKSLLICVYNEETGAIFDFSPHRVDVDFTKRKSEPAFGPDIKRPQIG